MQPSPRVEREAAYHLRSYSTVAYRARHLFHNAKARASKHSVPFSISRLWVEQRIATGLCEVTGLPLDLTSTGRGQGNSNPWAPSLDRIDPALGYTPGNTRVVVWMFNAAKHVGTDEDVVRLARALCKLH